MILEKANNNIIQPREDYEYNSGATYPALASVNSEVQMPVEGSSQLQFMLTGTFVGTVVLEGSTDGSNFNYTIPFFNLLTNAPVAATTLNNTQYVASIAGFKTVRLRCSAFTSGSIGFAARVSISNILLAGFVRPPNSLSITTLSTANTGATLTIPAGGANLFTYISKILIKRINNSAAAIAGTALLGYTSTNLPGTYAWSSGNALAVGDDKTDASEDYTTPLKGTAANTATTIVAPAAGAGVQVRLSAIYYYGG